MARLFKQRFFWQFAGGFLLGTAGMIALQPGAAADPFAGSAPVVAQAR